MEPVAVDRFLCLEIARAQISTLTLKKLEKNIYLGTALELPPAIQDSQLSEIWPDCN